MNTVHRFWRPSPLPGERSCALYPRRGEREKDRLILQTLIDERVCTRRVGGSLPASIILNIKRQFTGRFLAVSKIVTQAPGHNTKRRCGQQMQVMLSRFGKTNLRIPSPNPDESTHQFQYLTLQRHLLLFPLASCFGPRTTAISASTISSRRLVSSSLL